MKAGIAASLLGLGLLYAAFVVYAFVYSLFVIRTVPPFYFIVVIPFIVGFSMFPAYLFTGFLTGLLGNELSVLRDR